MQAAFERLQIELLQNFKHHKVIWNYYKLDVSNRRIWSRRFCQLAVEVLEQCITLFISSNSLNIIATQIKRCFPRKACLIFWSDKTLDFNDWSSIVEFFRRILSESSIVELNSRTAKTKWTRRQTHPSRSRRSWEKLRQTDCRFTV